MLYAPCLQSMEKETRFSFYLPLSTCL